MKEAKITIVKTRNGEYGLHGDTHWDALPYWEYYPASIVEVSHANNSEIKIFTDWSREIYDTPISNDDYSRAKELGENWALEEAITLEKQGYLVNLVFEEDYNSRDFQNVKGGRG
jgi:hypothetical protein